jgi:heat shock protein HtpX
MWELIRANQRRAALLIALMAGLLMAAGFAFGEFFIGSGTVGLVLAFLLWGTMTLTSWVAGDKILLATSGARRIEKKDHPVLWNVVEEMKIASGLEHMPAVHIIDSDAANAFATGRSPERSAVAVTSGLLERLSRDELQGVIAHELAHINNRDVLYLTMASIMMGSIVMMAHFGTRFLFFGGGRRRTSSEGGGQAQLILLVVSIVLIILAPIFAQMLYFALSRKREYLADASAAVYTRYPEGLADALAKLQTNTKKLETANPATAPMFIVNPLKLSAKGLSNRSSTHPPIDERIRILRGLAGQTVSLGEYDQSYRKITGRPVGVVPPGSLAAAELQPHRPATDETDTHADRARQATDALWRLNDYRFIACACGTSLKAPPSQAGREISCPHCAESHVVP